MSPRQSLRAFTLIELLVVISIIALLIALLLPALGMAKEMAREIACRSNQHQLSLAWFNYAAENEGMLVNGKPDHNGGFVKPGAGEDPIKDGALFDYCPDVSLWKCPSDPYQLERSFSIVGSMHGETWNKPAGGIPTYGTNKFANILNPADQLVFMEESDKRGWNRGSWIIDVRASNKWRWIDYVAMFHKTRANLGMADGHVETHEWQDDDTIQASQDQQFYLTDPGNEDWIVIRNKYRQLPAGPDIRAYETP